MQFGSLTFFDSFLDYLKKERSSTLAYLSAVAANEHWLQFEAADWLHRNRGCVGLGGYDGPSPECDILPEKGEGKKGRIDIWLQDRGGTPNQTGVGIECKVVHNNKNFYSEIKGLREDLGEARPIPNGLPPNNVSRYGLGVLVYVRYLKGSDGGYQILRIQKRGRPSLPEEFLSMFQDECQSEDDSYKNAPKISPMSKIEKVISLDDQPYIDPACKESSVWLVLLKRS